MARNGQQRAALARLEKLEALEPDEADWPRRAADCYRELGMRSEQLKALERAGDCYLRAHRLVQAMAIGRIILGIDPKHPAALAWVSELPRTQTEPAKVQRALVAPPPLTPKPPTAAALGSASASVPDAPSTTLAVDKSGTARELAAKRGLAAVARAVAAQVRERVVGARPQPLSAAAPGAPASRPREEKAEARTQVHAPPPPSFIARRQPEAVPVRPAASTVDASALLREYVQEGLPESVQEDLQPYVQDEDLQPYVQDEDLQPYVQDEELQPYVEEELPNEERPEELKRAESVAPRSSPHSLPPLSLPSGELHEVVPGSVSLLEGDEPAQGVYRLEIDEEQRRAEQTRRQGRALLPAIPLFSDMHPVSLERVWAGSTLLHLEAGEVVYHQNELPDFLYVIVNGGVRFVDDSAAQTEVYRLGESEFFGESALISNEPRPASAVAYEPTDLLAFDRETLRQCISETPELVLALLRFLRERLIEQLVHTSPLLTGFTTADRRLLTQRFQFLQFEAGATLVRQGSRSSGLFVVLTGAVEVIRVDPSTGTQTLATLERGDIFGEMSLLLGRSAVADVRGLRSGFALMLPAQIFREVIMTHPQFLEVVSEIAERRRKDTARLLGIQL